LKLGWDERDTSDLGCGRQNTQAMDMDWIHPWIGFDQIWNDCGHMF